MTSTPSLPQHSCFTGCELESRPDVNRLLFALKDQQAGLQGEAMGRAVNRPGVTQQQFCSLPYGHHLIGNSRSPDAYGYGRAKPVIHSTIIAKDA